MEMTKEEAIKYLKKKDEYCDDEAEDVQTKEEKVEEVMKKGKIYGDPTAEVEF